MAADGAEPATVRIVGPGPYRGLDRRRPLPPAGDDPVTRFVLTAAEMRAAEAAAIAAGTPGLAADGARRDGRRRGDLALRRPAARPRPVRPGQQWRRRLCHRPPPGGARQPGSGRRRGRAEERRRARPPEPPGTGRWKALADAAPAPLVVDALFGTGLARPLDAALARRLCELAGAARVRVAVDLPSGVATDDGAILSPVPDFDLTVTFATLKPSHLLQPAARHMGRIVVADIGIAAESRLELVARPALCGPGPDDHKYSRGYLLVVAGAMPGAAALAASAAARAGAGYVALVGEGGAVPNCIVRKARAELPEALADGRVDAVLVGPGLGRDEEAWAQLCAVMDSPHPVVLDGDALWLMAQGRRSWERRAPTLATPHAGEFRALFGDDGSKVEARPCRGRADRADHRLQGPGHRRRRARRPGGDLASGRRLAGQRRHRRRAGRDHRRPMRGRAWRPSRPPAPQSGSTAAPPSSPVRASIADDLPGHLPAAFAECL